MTVDLMIVGAPKSGTSSLLAYFDQHPGVVGQSCAEMHWFLDPEMHRHAFPESFYFPSPEGDRRVRVGKLARLMYDDGAVARLRQLNPDVRAVAILREPVARAYSAYWFRRRRGTETAETFEQVLDEPAFQRFYVDFGCYASHLERLHAVLGVDSVHVLILEEFVADPQAATAAIFQHVGLDPSSLSAEVPRDNASRTSRSQHLRRARRRRLVQAVVGQLPSSARDLARRQYQRLNEPEQAPPPMRIETQERLSTHFAGPNRRLEELLGRPIEAWTAGDGG